MLKGYQTTTLKLRVCLITIISKTFITIQINMVTFLNWYDFLGLKPVSKLKSEAGFMISAIGLPIFDVKYMLFGQLCDHDILGQNLD
jgi:hypothetical protein